MLVSKNSCGPNATPQRGPIMPNASQKIAQHELIMPNVTWVRKSWVWVGHVDFMFVSISFSLGSQREHNFRWNMDFKYPSNIINS